MNLNAQPGNPYPLGAVLNDGGINFCLYADNATDVELCLFNSVNDTAESQRTKMVQRTHCVWHSYLPGLKPG